MGMFSIQVDLFMFIRIIVSNKLTMAGFRRYDLSGQFFSFLARQLF